jgi:hypothetical protein
MTLARPLLSSRKGLSGANPEALRLDNRHGPLGRVMTRGLPLGPGHDFPRPNAALRPYNRGRTHSGPRRS